MAPEGERKRVTVLFADLRGSLGVIQDVDPEEVQELLDAVVTAMMEAVHEYQGAVNQVMGDGIMALFGAPLSYEDHALRAACAALAMQDAVNRLQSATWRRRGVTPQIRVGLHSGEVAIRAVHNDLSVEYRAVGTTAHIAARMEQLAGPGEVWLTDATHRLCRGRLRVRQLGPVRVKGVDAPLEAFALTGISVRTRFQANALRGLSPMINQSALLDQLHESLQLAAEGRSQVAVLCGDPGIGKSRVCYELLHGIDHARVLEASAVSYRTAGPYAVLASFARSMFGVADGDDIERLIEKTRTFLARNDETMLVHLPAALELLDVAAPDPTWARLDPVRKRRQIESMMWTLLARWCTDELSVLLFEDMHWCDAESLEFVARLVETPPGTRTLLLITHRPELAPPWKSLAHVLSCQILKLDAHHSQALLQGLIGDEAELSSLRSSLAQRTDGNPFFIEETARAMQESLTAQDAYMRYVTAQELELPGSIEAVLGARIDRLSREAIELLQAAAVVGDESPVEVLRAAADVSAEDFARQIAMLTDADLLYQTVRLNDGSEQAAAGFHFKHALIQEVVYRRMVRPRKRVLHARALDAMERYYGDRVPEHIDRIAEHAFRAELWMKCAAYEMRACVRAAGRSANRQALAHLERAIDVLRQVPEGPERDRVAIDVRLTALAPMSPMGAHERLIELLREAEALATSLGDLPRLGRVLSQLSSELWVTAQYDRARQTAHRALTLAHELGGNLPLALAARYNLAMIDHAQGRFEQAAAGLSELLSVFAGEAAHRRMGWAGYPSVLCRVFVIAVSAMTGTFRRAEQAYLEGRRIADELDHSFSRTMIMEQYGYCLLIRGEVTRARALLQEAMALCQRDEVRTMYLPIASHLAMALLETGALDQAHDLLKDAAAADASIAGHYAVDYLGWSLSSAELRSGRPEAALAIADTVLADTQRCGEPGFAVRAQLQRAAALALAGRSDDALQSYTTASEQARALGMPPWFALAEQGRARVLSQSGQRAAALSAISAARDAWHALDAPERVGQIDRQRARLLEAFA